MMVYRLARARFKNDLSGKGAQLAGGRWNSMGVPVLYTAESRSLCALEIAVHTALNTMPGDYMMITIEIPDVETKEVNIKDLPPHWTAFPEIKATQLIGDTFFRTGKYLSLKVPSAIIAGDYNILINPLHKDFSSVKVLSAELFKFDQRLFIKDAITQ
jgi:RES domain-containing protein